MHRRLALVALGSLALCGSWGGCSGSRARGSVVLTPEEAERWGLLPQAQARGRYGIRMSDGERDWEVEFPDVATGYEVRVPLKGGALDPGTKVAGRPRMTAADREMFDEPGGARGGAGAKDGKDAKTGAAQKKASYLAGIAQIKELYKARSFELALVHCVDLERDYQNDEKLLAMKGSIYRKLGKTKLARETWERVLQLNPDNTTVADALRELSDRDEPEGGGR